MSVIMVLVDRYPYLFRKSLSRYKYQSVYLIPCLIPCGKPSDPELDHDALFFNFYFVADCRVSPKIGIALNSGAYGREEKDFKYGRDDMRCCVAITDALQLSGLYQSVTRCLNSNQFVSFS